MDATPLADMPFLGLLMLLLVIVLLMAIVGMLIDDDDYEQERDPRIHPGIAPTGFVWRWDKPSGLWRMQA